MSRKLLAFDIDGTLLNSEKQFLDSTLTALKELRAAGHIVTIASGRNREFAKTVIDEGEFEDYILCNGAAAFVGHEQIYKRPLVQSDVARFVQAADEARLELGFQSLDATRRHQKEAGVMLKEAMTAFIGYYPDYEEDFYQVNDIYQMLVYFKHGQEVVDMQAFPNLRMVRWGHLGVDVMPKDGSKAHTIQIVAEKNGIPREDIIAFGDGDNDREMLQLAGIGVAMGNASDEVKSHGNIVTETNDHDGIWLALKDLGLVK